MSLLAILVVVEVIVTGIPGRVINTIAGKDLWTCRVSVLIAMHIRGLAVDTECRAYKLGKRLRTHNSCNVLVAIAVADRFMIKTKHCVRFCNISYYGRKRVECIDWWTCASLSSNSIREQPVKVSDAVLEVVKRVGI